MKKACLVVSPYLTNNSIFDDQGGHRDFIFDRFIKLKSSLFNLGYELCTQDINSISESEIVIYSSNMPKKLPLPKDVRKSFLILTESEFIRPDNYDKEKHLSFNKVFTWHDEFVDGKKYIKLNYAHRFPEKINNSINEKDKLCVLIAANKYPPHTNENDLYLKRREAIRWFECNKPNDFDLYGVGWDKYQFTGPRIIRAFNRIEALQKIIQSFNKYTSYRGTVKSKNDVMKKYKFSICFENAKSIPGYITEKIFDSFFAGCIPIYLGADNVDTYIPKNCFIDMRDFKSYEDLYKKLTSITAKEYQSYIDNIEIFLRSEESEQFKSEGFVSTLTSEIMESLNVSL